MPNVSVCNASLPIMNFAVIGLCIGSRFAFARTQLSTPPSASRTGEIERTHPGGL